MVVGCKITADSAALISRNLLQMNSKPSNEYQLKNVGLPPRTNLKTVSQYHLFSQTAIDESKQRTSNLSDRFKEKMRQKSLHKNNALSSSYMQTTKSFDMKKSPRYPPGHRPADSTQQFY